MISLMAGFVFALFQTKIYVNFISAAGRKIDCYQRWPALSPNPSGSFLYPAVRFIADPVSVDPLGSFAMGANVFPEIFLGWFAMRPVPTGLANR